MMRREFLLGSAAIVAGLPRVSLADALRRPLLDGAHPLVALIEDTPRNRLLEEIGSRVRAGLAYRELLGALFVAAVRNVQPRPVGFKFHAVLAINAAHQSSLAGPDAERWLPIFWSLDSFKGSQAEEKQKTGWTLPPVVESKVPAADKARTAFMEAVEAWDVEGVDGPAIALARHAGLQEAFELFARYGIRDFRDIGHKAIFVAGAFRLLDVIGPAHAEPVYRSLALALQYYTGESPAKIDAEPDRPWKANLHLAPKIGRDWLDGKADSGATKALLQVSRKVDASGMAALTLELLDKQVSPTSLWDGLFVAGGEILMRRPGILSLHALTTLNAMRYIFDRSGSAETRKLALLQAASFIPLFRGKIDRELSVDDLEPTDGSVEDIFADVSRDKLSASRKVLGFLGKGGDPAAIAGAARRLIFTRGVDAHDYKFSTAVLEDYPKLSPGWRERFLAAGVHHFRGSQAPENGLVPRIRAALKAE